MAANKRSNFQKERDREIIGRLYLRGKIQQEITDQINAEFYPDAPLSRQQIAYDIKVLLERWVNNSNELISQKKAIELQKLFDLENIYRDGWERSLQDIESTSTERTGVMIIKDGEIVGEKVKQTRKKEGSIGNPAFLNGILTCIARRCEILGLNAPANARNLSIDLSKLSDDQLRRVAAGEDIISVLANAS